MDTRQARCAPAAHQWDTDGSCTVCGATGRDVAARYQASVSGEATTPFKAGQRVRRVIDGYRGTVETVSAYQGTHAVAVRMDSDGAVWSGTTSAWEATTDETMGTYSTGNRVIVNGARNGFAYVTFVTGANRGTTVKVPSAWVIIDEAPTAYRVTYSDETGAGHERTYIDWRAARDAFLAMTGDDGETVGHCHGFPAPDAWDLIGHVTPTRAQLGYVVPLGHRDETGHATVSIYFEREDEAPTTGDPFDDATMTPPARPTVTRDPFDEATYARNVGANVTRATPYRIPVGDLFRTARPTRDPFDEATR